MRVSSFDLCGDNPCPMTRLEVVALKELVSELDSNPIIINIGADIGVSTLAMLEERQDALIFSIDLAPCERELENVIRAGLDIGRVIRILGRSSYVGYYWPPAYKVDFVFVDGDHSEAGVRYDISAWKQHIKDGGIMAFHDYIPEPIPDGIKGRVVYAVDDAMETYKVIKYTDRLRAFRIDDRSLPIR